MVALAVAETGIELTPNTRRKKVGAARVTVTVTVSVLLKPTATPSPEMSFLAAICLGGRLVGPGRNRRRAGQRRRVGHVLRLLPLQIRISESITKPATPSSVTINRQITGSVCPASRRPRRPCNDASAPTSPRPPRPSVGVDTCLASRWSLIRGERAGVQLVDHRAADGARRATGRRPSRRRRGDGAAGAVRSVRLARRAGIGERLAAVQPERVVGPGGERPHPPSTILAARPRPADIGTPPAHYLDLDPAGFRRPHVEYGHSPSGNEVLALRDKQRNGPRPVSTVIGTAGPWCTAPVSRSAHAPAGNGSAVSPQPPRRRRPTGSRVTTVTACPRPKGDRVPGREPRSPCGPARSPRRTTRGGPAAAAMPWR